MYILSYLRQIYPDFIYATFFNTYNYCDEAIFTMFIKRKCYIDDFYPLLFFCVSLLRPIDETPRIGAFRLRLVRESVGAQIAPDGLGFEVEIVLKLAFGVGCLRGF